MRKITLCLVVLITTACVSRPTTIAPKLRDLSSDGSLAPAHVGYFFPPAFSKRQVIQSDGGGESISFNPYHDLEPALQKVLFERFEEISRISKPPTPQSMTEAKLNYAFITEFSAQGNSDESNRWPKRFTLRCSIRAVDIQGKVVWSSRYQGVGTAVKEEWTLGSGVAGERAALIIFKKMQKDLRAAAVFDVIR